VTTPPRRRRGRREPCVEDRKAGGTKRRGNHTAGGVGLGHAVRQGLTGCDHRRQARGPATLSGPPDTTVFRDACTADDGNLGITAQSRPAGCRRRSKTGRARPRCWYDGSRSTPAESAASMPRVQSTLIEYELRGQDTQRAVVGRRQEEIPETGNRTARDSASVKSLQQPPPGLFLGVFFPLLAHPVTCGGRRRGHQDPDGMPRATKRPAATAEQKNPSRR